MGIEAISLVAGGIEGWSAVNKFGENVDVDAAEDVWYQGGTWVAPTAARVHAIVSGDAKDAAAGVGARTMRIYGLDGDYAEVTEDVTLNGTTPVNTTNSYTRINRMIVLTAGSEGDNAGAITATAASDSTVTASIGAGFNQTLQAIYCVPAGFTGYLMHYYGSVAKLTSATIDLQLWIRPSGQVWQIKHVVSATNDYVHHDFDLPLAVTEKSDIRLTAVPSTTNVDVCGGFDLVLRT